MLSRQCVQGLTDQTHRLQQIKRWNLLARMLLSYVLKRKLVVGGNQDDAGGSVFGDLKRNQTWIANVLQPLENPDLLFGAFRGKAAHNLRQLRRAVAAAHGPSLAECIPADAFQILQGFVYDRLG